MSPVSERTKIDARGTYYPGPLMELISALKLINIDDEIDLVPRQKAELSGRAVTQSYFSADRERMVMPAFGAFTGMHVLPRGAGDRVFAVLEDAVLAL